MTIKLSIVSSFSAYSVNKICFSLKTHLPILIVAYYKMNNNIRNLYVQVITRRLASTIAISNEATLPKQNVISTSMKFRPQKYKDFSKSVQIHQNLNYNELSLQNTSFTFKLLNNLSFYMLKKNFKCTKELALYFKKMSSKRLKDFREQIFNCNMISITLRNQTYFIDTREFVSVLEYRMNNLFEWIKWENFVKAHSLTSLKKIYTLPDKLTANADSSSLELFVFNFIKSNQSRMINICFKHSISINELVQQTAKLIQFLFGFTNASDFKQYSNKTSDPSGIVNEFNRLMQKNAFNNKSVIDFRIYKEIHFHLLFLILVDLNQEIKCWSGEKECRRMNTLLSNISKKSQTGYCDIFYKDMRNSAYIIELKYYRETNKRHFINLEDCKIFAIDQACSYSVLSENSIECFGIVVHVNQDNSIQCDLVTSNGATSKNMKKYERVEKVKLMNTKYETQIQEISRIFKIMPDNEYEDLRANNDGHELISIMFKNKAYFIDIGVFRSIEKTELTDDTWWMNLFKKIDNKFNGNGYSIDWLE